MLRITITSDKMTLFQKYKVRKMKKEIKCIVTIYTYIISMDTKNQMIKIKHFKLKTMNKIK